MPKVLSTYEEECRLQEGQREALCRIERAEGQSPECRLSRICARRRIAPFHSGERLGDVTEVDRRLLIRAERRAEEISAVRV